MLAGVLVGFLCGVTTRRARLCSFGAIEDAWMGGDTSRLRVFGLALAIALAATQGMILIGMLDPATTSYVPSALPWLAVIVGGLLFGIGMALAGTCGYGLLIRLGSGDLRCLVVLLVFGAVAYATLRGLISGFRIGVLEAVSWPVPGGQQGDLASLLGWYLGFEPRGWITAGAVVALIAVMFRNPRLRRSPRLLTAGAVLGLGVATGWIVTGALVDEFEIAKRAQSLTFVSPIGKTLYAVLLNPQGVFDFGVGTVLGVVLGAFADACATREFRWEAFDDDREMRRHLLGAVLMGFGGITMGGCTIGQGITAGSLMALSWPLAILGMMLGARIGIMFLVEGSILGVFRSLRHRPMSGRHAAE
jgi:uncharacterized membrane protein YedE/YeeE